MSNQLVGGVYQQIIEDVLEASKTDIEETGFDEAVLDELRKGWQQKLSSLDVAQFPWDPKIDPTPINNVPGPAQQVNAGSTSYTQAQFSPPNEAQHLPNQIPLPPGPALKQDPAVKTEPQIKQEPGVYHPSPVPVPSYATAGPAKTSSAQARATQLIRKSYGEQAVQSIGGHLGPNGAVPTPVSIPGPPGGRPSVPLPTAQNAMQYRDQVMRQQQLQMQAAASAPGNLNKSQVDGAADAFEGVLMQRGSDGGQVELGRLDIDKMLHDQISAKAKQMEGGGLMLPLKQATKHKSAGAAKRTGDPSQVDGPEDDAEYDEDAINSDLDDPEDDNDDEDDDDESSGPIMLCMYDKVQRVKNKWKCTLKDGVLTVNGKEYVFHKATGEYEW